MSVYDSKKQVTAQNMDKSLVPEVPFNCKLKEGRDVVMDWVVRTELTEEQKEEMLGVFNSMVEDGRSWPFEESFDWEAFEGYFLSHAAFALRTTDTGALVSLFYIRPNFPGRCSHVCNGGFITSASYRRQGAARIMGNLYMKAAPLLGYKSSCFNLVFASNPARKLWEDLGFERVGVIKNAGRLKGDEGLTDAYIMTYEF
eukprot:TRINITY_DN6253_c0_g1_i1.p1 TRINITY_DN6253_c0_g1~~TRINITY_DN6253_c0_g1_i1.p1  ORF type:complete len:200 (+),score=38.73 TRINITY_DN6253_c0_g1_i1:49-648(+)